MKARMLLVVVAFGLLGADDAKEEANKKEMKKFDGTWSFVAHEIDEKKTPDDELKKMKIRIKDGKYTVTADGQVVEEGTFTGDSTQKPKRVDVMPTTGGSKGQTYRGIYELEGDQLRYCMAPPGKERPAAFASAQGVILAVLKRDK